MAHELAGALQQARRVPQRCAVKEPHIHVRSEYIDVAEGRVSQTCNRTAVMQKLPDFVPAFSHRLEPPMRDVSQWTGTLFRLHPRIDGWIVLDGAVEAQQFRSHRRSTFCFRESVVTSFITRIARDRVVGRQEVTHRNATTRFDPSNHETDSISPIKASL